MIKDISNQRFGRLVAISPTGEKRWGVSLWKCHCDCGNAHIVAVNSLKSGNVKSCGCYAKEVARKKVFKHGDYGTPTYKSWEAMIQRCTNENNPNYKKYGAIGILVCDEWKEYINFKNDMGERPKGYSLDRINPFGNYEPENCRWANSLTQNRNRRKPVTTFEQAELVRSLYKQGNMPKKIELLTGINKRIINNILYANQISVKQ